MTILGMSLKIKGWRSIVKWVVWSILAVLFAIFLIRVVSFENYYYNEKEGSERATAEVVEEVEELIEEEPTKEEIVEYTVAADRPRYLSIGKIGVDKARILPMGINHDGELATPNNVFDVGWYEASSKPGQGGTLMIDGHNGGPHVHGVFKKLPDLKAGDVIEIERGDGEVFSYRVVENKTVPLDESDAYMKVALTSPEAGVESLTLISCTGDWSQERQTYLARQFTRAVLVNI